MRLSRVRNSLSAGLGLALAWLLVLGCILAAGAEAQTASILPNAMTQFTDANGAPYSGGKVFFYIPNTTTPKATWQDPYQTTLNTNPVTLDSAGRAIINGSGQYREVLFDQYGNTIWDQLTYAFGGSALTALTGTPTGSGALVLQNSPTLTGVPMSPTANAGSPSTMIANLASVYAINRLSYVLNNGIKCDGSTNDATALNTYFASIQPNTTIEFPGNATCVFQQPLVLPNVNNLLWHFNGATLYYNGTTTTGNLVTAGISGQSGGGGADGSFANWTILDGNIATGTVMTSGDGFVINDSASLFIRGLNVGVGLNGNNNFYNGMHFNGGNTIYVQQFSFRGSHAGEVINGDTSTYGGLQLTDAFHNQGTIANGDNIGLLIAGNCGGCYWDSVDVVGNHTNVRIDQSIAGIQNRQIRFGPNFASDGTAGSPDIGVDIEDPGAGGTQLFCIGCWISTAAQTCFNIGSEVTWEIHLIGMRMENCPVSGLINNSGDVTVLIDGGAWAQDGTAFYNNPGVNVPTVQWQARPAMYGNTYDESGLEPLIVSGCGGSGSSIVGDDYSFVLSWGSSAGTTCNIGMQTKHYLGPFTVTAITEGVSVYPSLATTSTTGISYVFSSNISSTQGFHGSASGPGF